MLKVRKQVKLVFVVSDIFGPLAVFTDRHKLGKWMLKQPNPYSLTVNQYRPNKPKHGAMEINTPSLVYDLV